jgi:UDP-2-acetamido-2-deoxy-ribo-hexuluronate aminotransferase
MGSEVLELEKTLSQFTGSPYSITCANGTDALQIALMAIDLQPGDEVITTPFSFISTVEVIALLGGKPVFCEIDETSYNLDATKLEKLITPKTKAIIPVSLFGQISDMDMINSIAAKHNWRWWSDVYHR